MAHAVTNIVIAGLGGQGVLTASDLLAEVLHRAGFDVKKSEIKGMSQRGGSVTSDVRFGKVVHSPMVPDHEADYLVVLAPDQVEPNRHHLRPGGVLIAPGLIDESRLSNRRTLNVALLGALSAHLDAHVPESVWVDSLKAELPAKVLDVNLEAFALGRAAARVAK
jgi:indolepyruvate ferredoxin oxidoreductase beta subunit